MTGPAPGSRCEAAGGEGVKGWSKWRQGGSRAGTAAAKSAAHGQGRGMVGIAGRWDIGNQMVERAQRSHRRMEGGAGPRHVMPSACRTCSAAGVMDSCGDSPSIFHECTVACHTQYQHSVALGKPCSFAEGYTAPIWHVAGTSRSTHTLQQYPLRAGLQQVACQDCSRPALHVV